MAMKAAVALVVALATLVHPECRRSVSRSGRSRCHRWVLDRSSVAAAATQIRLFGDVPSGLRVYLEGAWAARTDDGEAETDAFGAAYPYGNRVQAIEAYAERLFRPGRALVGFRAGRYRTPFGIHTPRRLCVLRISARAADSVRRLFRPLEQLSRERRGARCRPPSALRRRPASARLPTSAAHDGDLGWIRVSRVQGYHGPWIVGVSHISTTPYFPARFARGRSVFTGIDLRWTRDGVQVLGEWITGRPFDGTKTDGWHVGVIVHRQAMGPVTAVLRSEALDYDAAPPRARRARRHTIGGRVRLPRNLSAQVNLLHQTGDLSTSSATAVDLALTYSIRVP